MGIILFVILTIGQYLIAWAAYVEKRYTAESLLGSKLKKMQKRNKTNVDMDTLLNSIPTPTIRNTLPFQIPRAIWNTPAAIKEMFVCAAEYRQQQKEQIEREQAEQERLAKIEEDFVKEKELKKEGIRRRKEKFAAREKTEEELRGYSKLNMENVAKGLVTAVNPKEVSSAAASGGFWSDDDLTELIRLVKKYPSGSAARWDTISQAMNRSVTEVTFMAAKMKENGYRVPGHMDTDSVAENIIIEATKNKIKTKRPANEAQLVLPETTWSQEQQKLLELAIVKYPKTIVSDRWLKIANTVPGKTKEECLVRYRYLVELVKIQKSKANRVEEIVEREEIIEQDVCNENIIVEGDYTGEELNEPVVIERKGKPKNKRKERKKRMDFSSSEEESDRD